MNHLKQLAWETLDDSPETSEKPAEIARIIFTDPTVQGRNMVYGLMAQSPKYNWDQGSVERAQGSEEWDRDHKAFEPESELIRDQIFYTV